MDEILAGICTVLFFLFCISIIFGVCFLTANTWGLRHLDEIQNEAPEFLTQQGFKVVGSEGYQTCTFRGSAAVWYILEKNKITYDCYIIKARNRLHIWNLKPVSPVNISTEN